MKTQLVTVVLLCVILLLGLSGCSLRVRGTGKAQADNVEFDFSKGQGNPETKSQQ